MKQTQAFVYRWTHLPTGKWYIGSRTQKGCNPSDGYLCSSKIVKPMIESDMDQWSRAIICIGIPSDMRKLEADILAMSDAKKNPMSFNQSNGDKGWSTTGLSMTVESRARWLKKNIGRTRSIEVRERMSASYQSMSAEAKASRVSKALATRNAWTDDQKNQSAKNVSVGKTGVKFSQEHLKNMAISRKGFVMTQETKDKISDANKGKKKSAEHIAKVIAANKGISRGPWTSLQRASYENRKAST